MIYGIYTSGLGALMQNSRIDVIANNLANLNTPAFRRDQITFQERMVEALEDKPDFEYYNSLVHRHGGAPFIGGMQFDRQPGGYQQTGRNLDMAIEGQGFYVVREIGSENLFYTRAGNFIFNNEGGLVTADGKYEVLDTGGNEIRVSGEEAPLDFTVDPNGTIYQNNEALGTLQVVDFEDYNGLTKQGSMLFKDSGASVKDPGLYRINQGFLEVSSANPITEMVEMIKAMRVLESNLEMIKVQDQSLDRLVNDFGRLQR